MTVSIFGYKEVEFFLFGKWEGVWGEVCVVWSGGRYLVVFLLIWRFLFYLVFF